MKGSDISHITREIKANEEENNSKGNKFELILGTTFLRKMKTRSGNKDVNHYSKVHWTTSIHFNLVFLSIFSSLQTWINMELGYIYHADWPNLQQINLSTALINKRTQQNWGIRLLLSQTIQLSSPHRYRLMDLDGNKVNNNIQSKGCYYLSEASWNKMQVIDLGMNSIGDLGCKFISRCSWNQLTKLNLC